MSKIMRGKEVAEKIVNDCLKLQTKVDPLVTPTLLTIRCGNDLSSFSYEKSISKVAAKCGVCHEQIKIDEECDIEEIFAALGRLKYHGMLLLKPMPQKFIDAIGKSGFICKSVDVDCMFEDAKGAFYADPKNNMMPCTAEAVLAMMDYYGINVEGKHITIVGRSDAVGKPLAAALTAMDATVTLCHSKTTRIHTITSNADIIISAIGKAKHIGYYHTNDGQVLIDVGINLDENGEICGDIDTDELRRYTEIEAYTPVPGGIGVVTNYILMKHVITSALNFYKG